MHLAQLNQQPISKSSQLVLKIEFKVLVIGLGEQDYVYQPFLAVFCIFCQLLPHFEPIIWFLVEISWLQQNSGSTPMHFILTCISLCSANICMISYFSWHDTCTR